MALDAVEGGDSLPTTKRFAPMFLCEITSAAKASRRRVPRT
jgi:hypothetical protein